MPGPDQVGGLSTASRPVLPSRARPEPPRTSEAGPAGSSRSATPATRTVAGSARRETDPPQHRCRRLLREPKSLIRRSGAHAQHPQRSFLLTRLIEIVVHSDDLARSVDVATPELPTMSSCPWSTCSPPCGT